LHGVVKKLRSRGGNSNESPVSCQQVRYKVRSKKVTGRSRTYLSGWVW